MPLHEYLTWTLFKFTISLYATCSAIQYSLCPSAFGRLTDGPKNLAVVAGERMSMECRMDAESKFRKWDFFDVNGVTTTVYRHLNERETGIILQGFSHFGVQVNARGSGIIYANSTKLEDAGNYTCITRIGNNSDVKLSAQLIVFGTNSMTTFSIECNIAIMTLHWNIHLWPTRSVHWVGPTNLINSIMLVFDGNYMTPLLYPLWTTQAENNARKLGSNRCNTNKIGCIWNVGWMKSE